MPILLLVSYCIKMTIHLSKYHLRMNIRNIYVCSIFLTIVTLIVIFFKSVFNLGYSNSAKMANQMPDSNNTVIPRNIFDLEFEYLIDNECTKKSTVRTIQIVTSAVHHIEARSYLRKAYPKEELEKLGVHRVFLLGIPEPRGGRISQDLIVAENDKYNDIIQGNFYDTYRNLTYKNIMGLRWAVTQCEADYIIKMDDDMIVDMYSLMKLIESKQDTEFDILGHVYNDSKPERGDGTEGRKWFVTKEEYKFDIYPPYVNGWLYVVKYDAAKKLLTALNSERFFWVDDVLITGILAKKAKIIHEDIVEYIIDNPKYFNCCVKKKVECGFIVGPSYGNYFINIHFQRHSKMCFLGKCAKNTMCTWRHHRLGRPNPTNHHGWSWIGRGT